MEKFWKWIGKWGTKLMFAAPMILGSIGYLNKYPRDYLDAMYNAISLYGLNYGPDFINPWLEAARWTAPLATCGLIVVAFRSLSQKAANWWKLLHTDTIAIYGAGIEAESLEEDILKCGSHKVIRAENFVAAHTHVLMLDSDETVLRMFSQFLEQFQKGDRVYLRLEDFDPNALNCNELDLCPFSLSDLTAQSFWREHAPRMCERCAGRESVTLCFIGDGIYGEKLLFVGLLQNIYDLNQRIEYHLFGNWEEFCALHFDWKSIASPRDEVFFHDSPWYEEWEILLQSDMIVLCDAACSANLHNAQRLYSLLPQCELYMRLDDDKLVGSSILPKRIHIFGGLMDLCTEENILRERLLDSARKQHEKYRRDYPDSGIAVWEELDAFTRQSNISSTMFYEVNQPLFDERMAGLEKNARDEIWREMEHIRWNRYHYLHNWRYAPGKKNRELRTHADLVPYADLSREDQEKDLATRAH